MANAVQDAVREATDVVLVHDAARPFVTARSDRRSRFDAAAEHGAAIVAQPVSDTVKRVSRGRGRWRVVETIPRESMFLAQTPQAFRATCCGTRSRSGESGVEATDEAALAERAGHVVHIVEATAENLKITTADDLAERGAGDRGTNRCESWRNGSAPATTCTGWWRAGRWCSAGSRFRAPRGALGHSDADVVCHAATDAILGAASLGDIGRHFPDTDPRWKDASSLDLLRAGGGDGAPAGFRVVNLDVVVILERPKIAPYLDADPRQLARRAGDSGGARQRQGQDQRGRGRVGRGEAIAAHAVALLAPHPEREL